MNYKDPVDVDSIINEIRQESSSYANKLDELFNGNDDKLAKNFWPTGQKRPFIRSLRHDYDLKQHEMDYIRHKGRPDKFNEWMDAGYFDGEVF